MSALATRTWRGVTQDLRSADMAEEWANLVESERPDLILNPMQGCYSKTVVASAQTHARAGAIDLSVYGWSADDIAFVVAKGRQVGYKGSHRTVAQGFTADHLHAIALDSSDLSGLDNPLGCVMGTAAWQICELLAGRNGLAGRGADDGDRTHIGQSWEQYLASKPAPPQASEEDEMKLIQITDGNSPKGWALLNSTTGKSTGISPDELSACQRVLSYKSNNPQDSLLQVELDRYHDAASRTA